MGKVINIDCYISGQNDIILFLRFESDILRSMKFVQCADYFLSQIKTYLNKKHICFHNMLHRQFISHK